MPVAFVPSTPPPTHPGRFRAGALPVVTPATALGVPLLPDKFGPQARVVVEAAFGANLNADPSSWTWTDITGRVRRANGGYISISPMGRQDESSQGQPAGCAFQVDNMDGAFTAYDPRSPWYPYVRRNTPIRVRVNVTGLPADWDIRFQGYATGWTPKWDDSAKVAYVAVQAQGILRRLGQGKRPLRSALTRTIAGQAAAGFAGQGAQGFVPLVFWSFEDGAAATAAVEFFGGASLIPSGSVSWAADSRLTSSAPLPTWAAGSRVQAVVPGYTSSGAWSVAAVISVPATPAAKTTLLEVATTGTAVAKVRITLNNALLLNLEVFNSAGTEILGAPGVTFDASNINSALQINVKAQQSGADTSWTLTAFPLVQSPTSVYSVLGTTVGVATPSVTGWTFAPDANLGGATFGQVGVYNSFGTPPIPQAFQAWNGERATTRLARLCAEQGIPITITGGPSVTTMGRQGTDTFLALLRECETADQGVLYDGQGPGLSYVTRDARYNLTPTLILDQSADPPQVAPPFEPIDDDQRNRNTVKVDRKGGSSVTVTQQAGPLGTDAIDVYDTSLTVNIDSDVALADYGGWVDWLGTVEGFRYPTLHLNLAGIPTLAAAWLACNVSTRVDVLNVSSRATQHPIGTVRLMLEGWSEQIDPSRWVATGNMSPYDPWLVRQLATDVGDTNPLLGRLDTDDSRTVGDIAAGAPTLTVATNSGPIWTTAADDFPLDVLINGQRISISVISGATSPQVFTVAPAGGQVLYPIPSGSSVNVADPIILTL